MVQILAATPLTRKVPLAGNVVILTPLNVFAGLSLVSVSANNHVDNDHVVFKEVINVLSVPVGASLTLFTVSTNVFPVLSTPSLTVTHTVDVPR